MNRRRTIVSLALITLLIAFEQANSAPPPDRTGKPPQMRFPAFDARNLIVETDVEYGRAGQRVLKLDVIRPVQPSAKQLPAIVWIHGGGWAKGDKSSGRSRVGPFVASGNFVGFSVGYRLSGEAIWPAQIHDCKAAIRWLRANAERYGVDPERIGVWGSSAGGHLVNMLGVSGGIRDLEGECGTPGQSSRVRCVVSFCGPTEFLAAKRVQGGREPSAVSALLGGPLDEKKAEARQASPVTYVSAEAPPFLLVHGTADTTVPFQQAERFNDALRKAGAEVTLVPIQGGGHGFGGPEVHERVAAFFDKSLRGKDVKVSSDPIPGGETPAKKEPRR